VPRAPSGAVDIVREIAFLPRAPSYSAGCSICWSIDLRLLRAKLVAFLDTSPVTATVGMLLVSNYPNQTGATIELFFELLTRFSLVCVVLDIVRHFLQII
jgi:hypothetical protein